MGMFSEEVDSVRAAEIVLAWKAVPDDQVEDLALELAGRAAKDPELAREAVRSFRTEAGPPGIGWEAALHFERATQMWSQRRRRSEEHTSELQSRQYLVCRLLLEKKKKNKN